MSKRRSFAGIVGIAERVTPPGADVELLEESIFAVARAALADAGIGPEDLDGVVVSASDTLDGRAISLMVTNGSVAGVGRDAICTPSAGEHAMVTAVTRSAAGTHPTQLVLAWGRPSEANLPSLDAIATEPFFTRGLGLTTSASYAMCACAYIGAHGDRDGEADRYVADSLAAARRSGSTVVGSPSADGNWAAWPIRARHQPPAADGVVGFVITDEETASRLKGSVAWITGLGWVSDNYWLSSRGYNSAGSSAAAIAKALQRAGRQITDCEVIEWHVNNPYHAFGLVEEIGLCRPGGGANWLETAPGQSPSGGAYAGDTAFATGLLRVAAAARQVRGRTGAAGSGVNVALAHAVSGFAAQNASAFVMEG